MISLKPNHTTKPTTTPQLHVVASVISCALGVAMDYNDNDSKQTGLAGPTASTITPTYTGPENSQKTSPTPPADLFKYELIRAGKPVQCKKHSTHSDWYVSQDNKFKCRLCLRAREKSLTSKIRLARKRKKGPVNITQSVLCNLLIRQECRCALSGHVFKSVEEISIDRIDSAKSYTADNVQLVTKPINIAKHIQSDQDFIRMCKQVAEYNK